jgi:hypothetical protein
LLLADLAEATGDVAAQISGQTEILNILNPGQVRATREYLAAKFAGPSSALTPLQQLLKWSVSEPRLRSLSPFSKCTVADWVEDRIKEGSPNGLRAAIMVYPADARLAAYFGRALAGFALEKGIDPDEARRARAEADFTSLNLEAEALKAAAYDHLRSRYIEPPAPDRLRRQSPYTCRQATYDLRRLKRKELIAKVAHTNRYQLTNLARRVAVLFTKTYGRILAPGLSALNPHLPEEVTAGNHLSTAWRRELPIGPVYDLSTRRQLGCHAVAITAPISVAVARNE